MNIRKTGYAGCAWLLVAAVLGVGAYWGLGIAGPSALPSVIVIAAAAAGSLGLAVALWTGRGGRKTPVVSLVFGLVLAAIPLAIASDQTTTAERIGGALFGVAIVLSSAWAIRADP